MANQEIITADKNVDTAAVEKSSKAHDELMKRLNIIENEYGDDAPFELEKSVQKTNIFLASSAQSMLLAGREMVRIKEHVPHGEFQIIIEKKLKLNYNTARRMMSASIRLSKQTRITSAVTVRSKALELLTLDDDELTALNDDGSIAELELDDIDQMSTSELRNELRKAKKKSQQDAEVHERQLQNKDKKINDLDRKLHDKNELSWPSEVETINMDVTSVAGQTLETIEILHTHLDQILNFDKDTGTEETTDGAYESMAVVYYDACQQVFNKANDLMLNCHEVFQGYKDQARPMFTDIDK